MNINAIPVASVQTAAPARNPKIRSLVEGPILTTLLKLAAPNFADATARVTFLTLDAYFVSFLGGDALAGVALVFPFFLLMQTMATAAMGGGVSSAVARALGAGRQDDANALVWHGAAIALGMSAAFLIKSSSRWRGLRSTAQWAQRARCWTVWFTHSWALVPGCSTPRKVQAACRAVPRADRTAGTACHRWLDGDANVRTWTEGPFHRDCRHDCMGGHCDHARLLAAEPRADEIGPSVSPSAAGQAAIDATARSSTSAIASRSTFTPAPGLTPFSARWRRKARAPGTA
jgi:hypothetical protein